MKRILISPGNRLISLTKILMIIKLSSFFLLCNLLSAGAIGFFKVEKVTVKLANTSFNDLVTSVEKQTQYKFLYRDDEVEDLLVNLDVVNQPLDQVLGKCLEGSRFNYKILENNLIVISSNEILQQKKITGKVVDKSDAALPGVSVVVKGTTLGTTTDNNGDFSLILPPDAKTLTFSFIGMDSQDVTIGNLTVFNITLAESSISLDEVVVVGYGTQKKINVTGAIATVSGKDLVSTRVANITTSLIGTTVGVSGLQISGEAGRATTNIRIRGSATYGNSSPLIVIDGVEQPAEQAMLELNSMDPNDVSNISILKDAASTAVYGIRAANGVIIVTTKRGKIGKPTISIYTNYGITKATQLQESVTSYEWASMRNEGIRNEMNSFGVDLSGNLFSDDDLWKMQHNRDFTPAEVAAMSNLTDGQKAALNASPALYYGSHDLFKEQFNKTGPQKQLNLSVSGGNERLKYFTSFGYFNQQSITNAVKYHGADTESKFERYNFRTNLDIDVVKNVRISLNLSAQFGTTKGPGSSVNADPYDLSGRYRTIMQYIYDADPLISPGIIDDHLINSFAGTAGDMQNPLSAKIAGTIGSQNAVYNFLTSGTGYTYNTLLDNSLKLVYDMPYIVKGLNVHATLNYQDDYDRYVSVVPSIPSYSVQRSLADPNVLDFFGGEVNATDFESKGYNNWNKLYVDAGIDYAGIFGKNSVTGLFLGKASKYTMPGDSYNTPSGIMGLVGRVTYDYSNRYMAEFNMGYNGTEQFIEGERFGFFPAFSTSWVASNEPFFKENNWVTFLKLRASYGVVGNDLLGNTKRRYLYLPNTYNVNQGGYYLGTSDGSSANAYYSGLSEGAIGNPLITWEKAKKSDVGFEAKFIKNKLSVEYDWFYEERSNILTTLQIIPNNFGVSDDRVPPANVGKTKNQGYEAKLSWDDKIGQFGYHIEGLLSYSKNKVIYYAEALNPYDWMNYTGKSIGQRLGLISDGLYNTLEELANRPYNTFCADRVILGDIRYKDLNGDGKLDSKDMAPIGYPNDAQYHYGIKLGFDYKGFDLKMLFNGSVNGTFYLPSEFVIPFVRNAGNAWRWMYDGRWTPEKVASGEKITYPRSTYGASTSDNNFLKSDYWARSNDFFRLKNVEVGYSFPATSRFLKTIRVSSLRIYANANNVIMFKNDLSEVGIDPETPDNTYMYIFPLISTFNFGINLQF